VAHSVLLMPLRGLRSNQTCLRRGGPRDYRRITRYWTPFCRVQNLEESPSKLVYLRLRDVSSPLMGQVVLIL